MAPRAPRSVDPMPPAAELGDDESRPTVVSSVDRAIDVLMLFGRSLQPSLGVTEIAQELCMSKSGVHRVLTTLRRRRLVTFDANTRRYSLGQAAIALSQSFITRVDLQAIASESMAQLTDRTQETSTLAVRRHDAVVFRAQTVPDRELRLEVRVGKTYPLYANASGKAFLAFLPAEESDTYLEHVHLEPLSGRTITDRAALGRDLRAVRAAGFATSHGERLEGVASVAAPIFDYEGYPVAVLAVSGPAERFKPSMAHTARLVLESARKVSAEMGHRLT